MVVDGLAVEVVRKHMRTIRISIQPPDGWVRVSAPQRAGDDAILSAVVQHLAWIRKQQERVRNAPRQLERNMVTGESHDVWGVRCLLDITRSGRPGVRVDGRTIWLTAPAGASAEARRRILDAWYRQQIELALPELLEKWQPVIGEAAASVSIRRMTTRWGSCTPSRRTIRLNLELATRHPRCLEYVLVHELVHLLERSHNARFHALMDRFLPAWREVRDELNRGSHSPVLNPSQAADID